MIRLIHLFHKPMPTLFFAAFLLFFPSLVWADDPDIERVVVTASQKRTSLNEVIGNISRVEKRQLDLINHEHINQTLARVPGSWISRGNGQEHLTAIRSPVLTGAGSCGAFLIMQDGISSRAPGLCNANQLFDLNTEQAKTLEVVRGPGGAYYGSNAVHGIINLITADIADAIPSNLSLEIGPHSYWRSKFLISPQQGVWLAQGNISKDGGYKHNSGFNQQKLDLIQQSQWRDWRIKSVFSISNLHQQTAGFIRGFEAYKNPQLKRHNPNPEAYRDSQSARLYSRWRRQVGQGQLSITPYWRWTNMDFLQHYLPWQPVEYNSQWGIGIQSQYAFTRKASLWQVGFDWEYARGNLQEVQQRPFSPAIPAGTHYNYQVNIASLSPWMNLSKQWTKVLSLDAGVRYQYLLYNYTNGVDDGSACEQWVHNCRFYRPHSQRLNYTVASSHLGIGFQLDPANRLYARWSSGFRAPQATELFRLQGGQTSADLRPEKLDSIEFGWRLDWKTWQVDLSLFDMQKHHFIFQDTTKRNISNGQTQHQGLELALNYRFAKAWQLRANGTWAKHIYANKINLSNNNIKGNRIDTAPNTLASIQLHWRFDAKSQIELEWQHIGHYALNPENTAHYSGHTLLNLRGRYQINNEWAASFRLLNLANQDYAERADFAFARYRYFVGEPRSLFMGLHWQPGQGLF